MAAGTSQQVAVSSLFERMSCANRRFDEIGDDLNHRPTRPDRWIVVINTGDFVHRGAERLCDGSALLYRDGSISPATYHECRDTVNLAALDPLEGRVPISYQRVNGEPRVVVAPDVDQGRERRTQNDGIRSDRRGRTDCNGGTEGLTEVDNTRLSQAVVARRPSDGQGIGYQMGLARCAGIAAVTAVLPQDDSVARSRQLVSERDPPGPIPCVPRKHDHERAAHRGIINSDPHREFDAIFSRDAAFLPRHRGRTRVGTGEVDESILQHPETSDDETSDKEAEGDHFCQPHPLTLPNARDLGMTATDFVLVSILLIMFGAAVVLGAAEASLLRVQRVRVEVQATAGDRSSKRLLGLLDDLPRVLNTVLLVVLLVQIGAATVVGVLSGRHFGNLGVTVASIALTVVLFVYAEAIPKTYAVRHPYTVARATVGLVAGLAWVLRPVVSVLVRFADLQAPGTGIATSTVVTEQELRKLALDAAVEGSIEETDRNLMERAFDLGDRTVDEILTPRTEIVAVGTDATIGAALEIAIHSGHRRLPVYEGELDRIRGVVRLHDLAAAVTDSPDAPVLTVATEEIVVPETKRVIDLLSEMQRTGVHLAVAVDEHGGTAGIVTIEDVVAELVGRVSDEGEILRPALRALGNGRWRLDAGADVEDLEAASGVELPAGDWHTVGGLVVGIAGRIPERGETFRFDGISITILDAEPHRVVTLEAVMTDQDPSS
jgi:CBS domain containing-hemolysin-like protein